jgi:hypothetical protein
MRFIKIAVCLATIGAAGLGSAGATETANVTTCLQMASQVKTALEGNMQSANYDAAKKEQGYGRDFCTNSFYARGISHYDQALKLLGVAQKG